MTSREQFEAWVGGQYPCEPMEDILLKVGPEKERYHLKLIQRLWEAWQASREALEVELPAAEGEEGGITELIVDLCSDAIRAAGIKVKGE
ncbi:MAG: hypothetical protein [Bacteriophage sp.]|nr:MAG: hypothetical protein [Bacteriophage sp.]